ncbi:hypothetical protein HHK36_023265 [Tetracentron sinense]|uniref:PIPK domain-containing protein n=1 Tax=Tetracentron sinense TaxID=13715 RepID=A0A834YMU0_TETSI|nr:hypothetical protein HHK36_023265 [Tetracentron sinense]
MAKIKVCGDLRSIPHVISLEFHATSYPLVVGCWDHESCDSEASRLDLRMAKIKVCGDLRSIPRVISLEFYATSYPLVVGCWDHESCDSEGGWSEFQTFDRRREGGSSLEVEDALRRAPRGQEALMAGVGNSTPRLEGSEGGHLGVRDRKSSRGDLWDARSRPQRVVTLVLPGEDGVLGILTEQGACRVAFVKPVVGSELIGSPSSRDPSVKSVGRLDQMYEGQDADGPGTLCAEESWTEATFPLFEVKASRWQVLVVESRGAFGQSVSQNSGRKGGNAGGGASRSRPCVWPNCFGVCRGQFKARVFEVLFRFGRMVACFRYASIDVHSVYLPLPKHDFNCGNQEWIQKEANEVVDRAEILFTEVLNALSQIAEKRPGTVSLNSSMKPHESRYRIAELEGMLQREKAEFERQLLFHSYVWDQRLVHAASSDRNSLLECLSSSIPKDEEKAISSTEKLIEMNVASNQVHQGSDICQDPNHKKEGQAYLSHSANFCNQSDPLESRVIVRRALSEGQVPLLANLSDTLDAAWTGENQPGSLIPKDNSYAFLFSAVGDSSTVAEAVVARSNLEDHTEDQGGAEVPQSLGSLQPTKGPENLEGSTSWVGMPFLNFYRSDNKNSSGSSQKLDTIGGYNPIYVSSFLELERQGGARLMILLFRFLMMNPRVLYHMHWSLQIILQMSDDWVRPKDGWESSFSLPFFDSVNLHSLHSFDETTSESFRSLGSTDDGILSTSGSRSSLVLDPLLYTKALHVRVSFTDDGPQGKVKYTVTCYYAKRFEALRRICCPSELDFIRSLCRCKKWGAQGGKSNVFFAKTLDDQFFIKQVSKLELESFIKFAPEYFMYLSESIGTGSPTCLAKILGIYQNNATFPLNSIQTESSSHLKGGKESRMDVLVMENLLFGWNVTRLYDLKGSSRSNPDSSGSNKVLLDQTLIEAMPTSPIFVGHKAKRLFERAVWNDTSFLAIHFLGGRGSSRGLDILTMTPGEKIAVAFNENGQPISKTTSKTQSRTDGNIPTLSRSLHPHPYSKDGNAVDDNSTEIISKFRQLLAMSGQDESSSSIGDDIYTQVEKWAEIPEHSKEMMWLYIQAGAKEFGYKHISGYQNLTRVRLLMSTSIQYHYREKFINIGTTKSAENRFAFGFALAPRFPSFNSLEQFSPLGFMPIQR